MARLIRKRETLLFLIIVAMIAIFSTRASDFATPSNLASIFNDTSILIILALGANDGDPDEIDRSLGCRQSRFHRHGDRDDERRLSGHCR